MRFQSLLPVLALTALGAALRLPTLDAQSFWLDELVTVALLDRSPGDVLGEIPRTEATPYAYYVLAWAWGAIFGVGEVGLRALSAVVGTATIPIAYGAGAALVSRRAGLVAGALVAVNPFLVWYSQEARAYALVVFLCACSLLALARALRGGRASLAVWAFLAGLAIATHYFAAFVVTAEALWLLVRLRPRRRAIVASALPVAVLVAHLPLLLAQRDNAEAVSGSPLAARIAGVPKNLAVGYSFPFESVGSALAALLLLVGAVLVARLSGDEGRGALVAGSVALAGILTPIVLALLGIDFLVARNTIVGVVPAAVCLGAGYAARRSGLVAAGLLCALSTAVALAPAVDVTYGRTDWRGAARALEAPEVRRAIVVTPFMSRSLWHPYLPGLEEPVSTGAVVGEIAAIGLATEGGYSTGGVTPPPARSPRAIEGFRIVEVAREPTFTLVRYRADTPMLVSLASLAGLALAAEQPGVLLQSP
jgi:hypothetical protein